jgi:hypothetical protein
MTDQTDQQQAVVKYSWQFGPYLKAESACNHREEHWLHNDSYRVFSCDGERDECICDQCGRLRSFRCDW